VWLIVLCLIPILLTRQIFKCFLFFWKILKNLLICINIEIMENHNRKKESKTPKQISQPIVKYRMRNFNNQTIEILTGLTCSTVKLLEDVTGEKQMQVFYKFNSITLNNCLNYCKSKDRQLYLYTYW